ncbi:uncharacterized protein G2W53_043245 [Senna tora]|uniref:Uncharacterized protein n=1 Tax=Senna tora TaxID=362788 RepID=A0A834SV90_9FABA|nr:uncharacterized protein G2W53_043245 [Senna tora]
MFSPSHLKTSHPLQLKSPSSTLISTKLKSLINTLILCRIIRGVSKVKAIILDILGHTQALEDKKKKIILGSFRLHYNWCSSNSKSSSHVLPVPAPVYDGLPSNRFYYSEESDNPELAGYLQWLEEKVEDKEINNENIDVLAEMFIANCHEKFRLEKQESDRRFQEMLARSIETLKNCGELCNFWVDMGHGG